MSLKQREIKFKEVKFFTVVKSLGGGGGTPLQGAKRDVPLDGVAFSRLE